MKGDDRYNEILANRKLTEITYKCINPTLLAHPEELKCLVSIDSKSTCFIRLKVQRNNIRISDRAFSI